MDPVAETPPAPAPECCPKCGSEHYRRVKYRAPGVPADDCTCTWMECEECGHKTDPC
jgi:hypothetical protein